MIWPVGPTVSWPLGPNMINPKKTMIDLVSVRFIHVHVFWRACVLANTSLLLGLVVHAYAEEEDTSYRLRPKNVVHILLGASFKKCEEK